MRIAHLKSTAGVLCCVFPKQEHLLCVVIFRYQFHCTVRMGRGGGEWAVGLNGTHMAGLLGVPAGSDSLHTYAPSSVFPV